MKPQPSQAFTIPIGDFSLRIPAGALVPDSTFWNAAIEADRLAREGYGEISRREVERLQAFFASFPGEPKAPTQLPARWMVLRVIGRRERFVVDTLRDKGLEVYAPLHITWAKHAKRIAHRVRPLMPGYLFASLPDDDAIDEARSLRGVEIMCRTDPVSGLAEPMKVRSIDIGAMILAEACHMFDETWEPPAIKGPRYSYRWKPRDRVRISGGPFDGFNATVLRGKGKDRMELLLTVFGREQEVVVPHKQITKLN